MIPLITGLQSLLCNLGKFSVTTVETISQSTVAEVKTRSTIWWQANSPHTSVCKESMGTIKMKERNLTTPVMAHITILRGSITAF